MPPIRFLHAAGLDPDAVPSDIPAAWRDSADVASLAAVERLVAQAIDLEIDFLLVTPAIPRDGLPDGPSLRSEAALREQFDRMAEEDIAVFLAVGARPSGWERLAGRGSNIVLLTPGSETPITDRDGQPLATLRCLDRLNAIERSTPRVANGAWELAVAPRLAPKDLAGSSMSLFDHVALGTGRRETVQLPSGAAHAPGPMQADGPGDTGSHGATLVSIDDAGQVRIEEVPTAAVRFESVSIRLDTDEAIDDLALRMSERLAGLRAAPGERIWHVRWTIEAVGALYDALDEAAGRADLIGLLPESVGDVPIVHDVQCAPHPLRSALDDPFAAEFAAALKEQESALMHAAGRLGLLELMAETPHRERLTRLLAETDPAAVLGEARRLGHRVSAAAAEADG